MKIKTFGKWILSKLNEYKFFILGFVLVCAFLFSNIWMKDQILSFTNINYKNLPFNSCGVEVEGPTLSDVADSAYPSIYKTFYSEDGISNWDNSIALGTETKDTVNLINPMNLPFAFNFETAILLKAILEFLVGFISMYLFMRSIGLRRFSAAMSGVMYTFSSVIVVWLGWPHSDVAVIAPLLFFAIEKLMNTVKIKYAVLISLVVYSMLIVGMPTYAAYFLYLAGIYIVFYTFKIHWKSNKRCIFAVGSLFALSIIIGAVMSFPYTLSLLNGVGSNGYAESRSYQAELKLSFDYFRTMVFPYIRDNLRVHMNESTVYVGLLPVMTVPLMFANTENKKRNLFFVFSAICVVLLIFTDVLTPVYTKLPMINTSGKIRVITLLTFALATLGGIALNDIIENFDYYRKKIYLIPLNICWIAFIIYGASQDIYKENLSYVYFVIWVTAAIMLGIILCLFKFRRIACVLISAAVMFDCVSFAREYLPWISNDAPVVPKATDSVEYLMENTDTERVSGIGGWTLFPNTPTYYDLNDIRSHNFIMTNADMKTYYQAMSDTSYTTSTRVVMPEIDNYELLKYLGVKYIYDETLGIKTEYGSLNDSKQPIGSVKTNSIVRQEIEIGEETLLGAEFLFATYGKENESQNEIVVSVYDESGSKLTSGSIAISEISDNSYAYISFDEYVELEGGTYTFELAFPDMEQSSLTLWKSNDTEGDFEFDSNIISGTIISKTICSSDDYSVVYRGNDGLVVGELNEYSDKVELAETVNVFETQDEAFAKMQEDYADNTAFITSENAIDAYNRALSENEKAELLVYENDYIKINCNCERERLLLINDYYANGWNVYINGEKSEIIKANYLMRGVMLPVGENITVELKYEPNSMKFGMICFVSALVLLLFVCIFSRKLQRLLDEKFLYAKLNSNSDSALKIDEQSDKDNSDEKNDNDNVVADVQAENTEKTVEIDENQNND